MSKYTSISLPKDLVVSIKKLIDDSKLGYTSTTEFVKEAIRKSFKEVDGQDD